MTKRRRIVKGLLANFAPGFEEHLAGLGYGTRRAGRHHQLLADLSDWLEDAGLVPAELTAPWVARFLEERRTCGHRDLVTPRGVALLLDYLRGLGVVPAASRPEPDGPAAGLTERYRDFLVGERALAERTVARYVAEIGPFVGRLNGANGIDWATLSSANVARFVTEVCAERSPSSSWLASLRAFLRFAYLEGWIGVPFAQSVPSMARWGGSSLPRRLEPDEVVRLLGGCDRHQASGRRDYAILTLLVRLGLRAGEVTRIQLGDIDWRAGDLLVHGKGPREEKLPLPEDVGEALADYVQHGRPITTCRAVFLRLHVPVRGLTPIGVTSLVYRACSRAGLPPVSAHHLRHTAATTMLRAGASLAEVGQALRQRSASATAIYAKVDHGTLVGMARPWPEGAAS